MMGGIFVPSMTGGVSEPKFQVQDSEGKLVKESYTGSIAYVPPGDYSVVVGTLVAATFAAASTVTRPRRNSIALFLPSVPVRTFQSIREYSGRNSIAA